MREGAFLAPQPFEWNPESTLSYLNKAGIAMQMLSYIPPTLPALKASNDYGASLVSKYPSRFGLLAALPTDNPAAALDEIERATGQLHADGFAVTCVYNNISLSSATLDPVWAKLNDLSATVFVHPNAYAPPTQGRPAPLIEVAFETARTIVDMLYAATFRRYPHIRWIIAHCGGALPVLFGRLQLLGTEPWVPNPNNITKEEMLEWLGKLYLDTAATAPSALGPGLCMTSASHIVYGADCGVPCSTEETMEANRHEVLGYEGLSKEEREAIGRNVLVLFPAAGERLARAKEGGKL
jgi:predicted TIM-barrel fold metal-dependent hydrolase